MSSASSAITYTSVYTDFEPGRVFWGTDEEISDEGSPRVIVYGYDGLPMQPVAPPSPDYIPGPEDPQTPPVPQDKDEIKEQPLPPVDSPTAESPGYVTESDPEEDPEEYEDDETEDGPVDYPMDEHQIVETLRVMRDISREMGDMQAELLALREQQRRARQPGPDV
ncbi:hypothetical protein Tco_0335229 [Tanacetum coccineum]